VTDAISPVSGLDYCTPQWKRTVINAMVGAEKSPRLLVAGLALAAA